MDKTTKYLDQYRLKDPTDPAKWYEDGACFLKVIIQTAFVDTRATTSLICRNLRNLPTYIKTTANNDIQKFNVYVSEQTSGLG